MTRHRVGLLLATVLLAGCTPQHAPLATPTPAPATTIGSPVVSVPVAPRSTILTTPSPTLRLPSTAAEVDGVCPYISTADFKAYEGDKVGRVVVLRSKPVGCRFYFAVVPGTIIGEVYVNQFSSAIAANNALAIAAAPAKHPEVQSDAAIGQGSVAYKTALQGVATWQCSFLRNDRVYTVRTRQDDVARDAFNLAKIIAHNIG